MSQILGYANRISKYGNIIFTISVFTIIAIILWPVPAVTLDLFFSLSIALSILILVNVLFINQAVEFTAFPAILLISTLLRLSLNIASTRLILSRGNTGMDAAGQIISSFGNFAMQGSVVIGIIIFIIITIINFIVITKGSERIAEVAARFNLDAMPGKQLAIDADVAAGVMTSKEAQEKRAELAISNTFFGAMDGASKFVRGDAIAGILITLVNFVGGLLIGTLQYGMAISDALGAYSVLTIGDGLVSQIPALIVSVSSGLLVTKSDTNEATNKAIFRQISNYPIVMVITSVLLLIMGSMPGMPLMIFILTSALIVACVYVIYVLKTHQASLEKIDSQSVMEDKEDSDRVEEALAMDVIRLELGSNLVVMIDKISNSIKSSRIQFAADMGVVIPTIRVRDNLSLGSDEYKIFIKESVMSQNESYVNKFMVINPNNQPMNIGGVDGYDPTFGIPIKWVTKDKRAQCLAKNYTIVEPNMVIVTNVIELVKANIGSLISYDAINQLITKLSETDRKLVEDLIPTKVSLTLVKQILESLLKEQVSIKNLADILETIGQTIEYSKDITFITEQVRIVLKSQISSKYLNRDKKIDIISVTAKKESLFNEHISQGKIVLPPRELEELVNRIQTIYNIYSMKHDHVIFVVSSNKIRPLFYELVTRFNPSIVVLSQNEIPSNIKTHILQQL
ncbi:MAG: flagellar biosynthesis protein [Candidatus Xenolissoclinum pacificiensis L6]|uniref:Flagellar biosynthesis protein n=1 Tax=Candidatus Xenolissoclinum pacificiensis L6 TaxID=1401685 RepID=W2V2F1_9RICK|nr:MAG: flagellar biosynthesis protein [Candidatus Xenolissoclinum pacificiensis L6]